MAAGLQMVADKVDERDGVFSFSWNGTEDKAELIEKAKKINWYAFAGAIWQKMNTLNGASINREVTNQTI